MSLPISPTGPVTITLPAGIVSPSGPVETRICPTDPQGVLNDSGIPPGVTDFTPDCGPITGPIQSSTGPGPVYTIYPPPSEGGGDVQSYRYNAIINGDFSVQQRSSMTATGDSSHSDEGGSDPVPNKWNYNINVDGLTAWETPVTTSPPGFATFLTGIFMTSHPRYGPFDRWLTTIKHGNLQGVMYTPYQADRKSNQIRWGTGPLTGFPVGQLSSTSTNNVFSYLTTIPADAVIDILSSGDNSYALNISFSCTVGNTLRQSIFAKLKIYAPNPSIFNSNLVNQTSYNNFNNGYSLLYSGDTVTIVTPPQGPPQVQSNYIVANNISLDLSQIDFRIEGLLVEIEITIPNSFVLETPNYNEISISNAQLLSGDNIIRINPTTAFAGRHYAEELELCQSFFYHQSEPITSPLTALISNSPLHGGNTVGFLPSVSFPSIMRLPTANTYNRFFVYVRQLDSTPQIFYWLNEFLSWKYYAYYNNVTIVNNSNSGFTGWFYGPADGNTLASQLGGFIVFSYFRDVDFIVGQPP